MADKTMSNPAAPGNGVDDIFARLSRLLELRLSVRENPDLDCVEINIAGLEGKGACILGPDAALDMALRLTGAVARLRNLRKAREGL